MIGCRKLSFSYASYTGEKNKRILSSIDLEIMKSEKVLILGEPESGKTTLSKILSSLIPLYQDGEMEGEVFPPGDMKERMDSYSLIPQNSEEFILTGSVEDELAYPLESLGLERDEMERRVSSSLERWGLMALRSVSTSELSGGEKRRMMIASSLITEPEFVIYDEAFDDLDPRWREGLKRHIAESSEASLVFASRFLSIFNGLFQKIYILKDGTLHPWSGDGEIIPQPAPSETNKDSVLECSTLSFIHPRRSAEVAPFLLTVPEFHLSGGECVALMGHNGSGKSTFSRLLCGLAEQSEGSIKVNGKEADTALRNRAIGYMFQNPDYQIFLPTVRDELEYSFSFLPMDKEEKKRRVEEIASLFSLDLDATATLMSYGARKRLQGAIYYSLDRPFYILDELDSALSYSQSVKILENLKSRGAGIVLITHDEDFASRVTDRRYRAEEGRIYEE